MLYKNNVMYVHCYCRHLELILKVFVFVPILVFLFLRPERTVGDVRPPKIQISQSGGAV